jgi:hypothetical protein
MTRTYPVHHPILMFESFLVVVCACVLLLCVFVCVLLNK